MPVHQPEVLEELMQEAAQRFKESGPQTLGLSVFTAI